jgi:hypothetical protein
MGLVVTIRRALQIVTSSAKLKFLALGFLLAVAVSLKGEYFLFFLTFFYFGGGAILDVDGEATDGGSDVDLCLYNGTIRPPPNVDRLDVAGGLTPGLSEPGN